MLPDPHGKDWLRRTVITVRLLRNFFQLFQKLWTTLSLFLQNIVSHVDVFPVFKKPYSHMVNLKIYRGVSVLSTFLAVMRCSYQFFAVMRYSEPPNAPLFLVFQLNFFDLYLPLCCRSKINSFCLLAIKETFFTDVNQEP